MAAISRLSGVALLVKNLLIHPQFLVFRTRVIADTIALKEMAVDDMVDTDVS
jgi:hypothetical protein